MAEFGKVDFKKDWIEKKSKIGEKVIKYYK